MAAKDTSRAYALQAEEAHKRERRGDTVIGYKIGCTSGVIRRQLEIDEPIYGRLFASGRHESGVRLSHGNFVNLAIEGELAVRLGNDLPGNPTALECESAIESIFPVIELHHYFSLARELQISELITSNGMNAGLVAPERTADNRLARAQDLTIHVNGRTIASSNEPFTMKSPEASLQWLAIRLAIEGLRLLRGQIILTGSALPLFPIDPGDAVVVEAPPLGLCQLFVEP